jgi:benzylsuccinate CoA-transferase BbsE subunit
MPTTTAPATSPLADIRVIDLADELAAYASRLLGDLGAEVIRIEPPGGSSVRHTAPIVSARGRRVISAFDRFVNSGKRSVTLDLSAPEAVLILERLLASADLVIESSAPVLEEHGFDSDRLRALNPGLCRVIVTPFGLGRSPSWSPVNDLMVLGAGGLLHLGGYPDVGPVAAYGGQSRFAASIFAAAAAMTAVLQRDIGGHGVTMDVSAQECVAQALEDSAATYALTGRVRERQGEQPREAGTGIYQCRDGYVSMVAGRLGTARAWVALVNWLNEENSPGAAELLEEHWRDFSFRQKPEAIAAFTRIFQAFTAERDKRDLYREAQARMIALSPVSTVDDLFENEQLRFREFFVDVEDDEFDRMLRYPSGPYRLSSTPPSTPRPAPALGQDTVAVLIDELGMTTADYQNLAERGIV